MLRSLICLFFFCSSYSLTAQELYFPPDHGTGEWATTSPESLNWRADSIQALYDYLETEESKSFLLLKDGKIVLEQYFGTYTQDSLWAWFSAGKSLRAFLVGQAQESGALDINDPVSDYLGTGWTSLSAEREDSILIRHQLTMSTGLNELFFHCTLPACLFYQAAVNTRWVYHNAPYNLLKDVLETATDMTINQYTNPLETAIGGSNGFWFSIDENTTTYISQARLMARFGLLMQNNGNWAGNQLLSDTAYLSAMTTPSQTMNPAYGYLWWLNGQESYIGPDATTSFPGPLSPDAPQDVMLAAGANGQFISISRETGLVMIRQGGSQDESYAPIPFHNEIWRRILSLSGTPSAAVETDFATSSALKTYPNPATNFVRFDPPNGDYTAWLLDQNGRLLMSVKNESVIDLRSLAGGHYHLQIQSEAGWQSAKVIKE